jgi:hypothetical protein
VVNLWWAGKANGEDIDAAGVSFVFGVALVKGGDSPA